MSDDPIGNFRGIIPIHMDNKKKLNLWSRFWLWYEKHFTKTLLITFGILLTQIPHWLWGGDILLEIGTISRQNIIIDFFLYGIDFLEVPLIIHTGMQVYSKYGHRR